MIQYQPNRLIRAADGTATYVAAFAAALPVLFHFSLLDPWLAWAVYVTPSSAPLDAFVEFYEQQPKVAAPLSGLPTEFDMIGGTAVGQASVRQYDEPTRRRFWPGPLCAQELGVPLLPSDRLAMGAHLDFCRRSKDHLDCLCFLTYGEQPFYFVIHRDGTILPIHVRQLNEYFYLNALPRGPFEAFDMADAR
ncbi:hypothetical protein [Stratiformator vulcanicus]|uniref:Uncharacterized protein n=1 Tax=Stratiformator vulcanicus TaxID=2527980 RepID=A0A517R763_9PLAN|nr:hypothetical protein [Stratiformator vulcanicus]QDT39673.1 hypothetical protein Pan189_40820 [Stratiformator vulcanicus]